MTGTIQITDGVPTLPTVVCHYMAANETVKTVEQHHVPRMGEKIGLSFRQNERGIYHVDDLVRFPQFMRGGPEHVNVMLTFIADSFRSKD